jgi:3-oxoacyl-[acyl-carrier-protein] synthase II
MGPGMSAHEVCVTGIGLITSIGEGIDQNWAELNEARGPSASEYKTTGFLVHPLIATDFASQIPNKLDQKRMGGLQTSGVYAAGIALEDAGLKGAHEVLARSIVIVGGAGGERDTALDERIFAELHRLANPIELNEKLTATMRPTTFLSQLPNLLAGNVSILFGVTAGSRTMIGEELAGGNAVGTACRLIRDGAYDVALVGGACNAEREELLLQYAFGGRHLWPEVYGPVWSRSKHGGGFILGSMGVFLVLESAEHANMRGKTPYCRISGVVGQHASRTAAGAVTDAIRHAWKDLGDTSSAGQLGVISGATGISRLAKEELAALGAIDRHAPIRGSGSIFGHGVEASFPLNLALGAIALRRGHLYPPFDGDYQFERSAEVDRVMVTSVGYCRGETIALLTRSGG